MTCVVIASLLGGCSLNDLFRRPTPTPPPTRAVAPTFTPTPDFVQALVVVTPPSEGTPGVIVVPPGVDPRSVIPVPNTPTPTITQTPTPAPATSTSMATDIPAQPDATLIPTDTPAPGAPDPDASPIEPTSPPTGDDRITPSPTDTPIPSPTTPLPPTPLPPTETPTPTTSATPTVTPTPFIRVPSGLVNLRAGPGVQHPLVAQLGPNIPVAIVGQNPEGTWFQICCVNGESVWVAEEHIETVNDTQNVALTLSDPPPTPTPTGTPTETPTITPTPTATPYPFQVAEGPLYFPTNNPLLTIWAKIMGPGGEPLPGYFVEVEFRNRAEGSAFQDRPNTKGEAPSEESYVYNVPPGPGSGNRVQYNYKFEFLAPDPTVDNPETEQTRLSLIDGYWRMYVTDGSGTQLSDAIQFDTLSGNNNREVYVAWVRTR